jgi:hypothetical protein
MCEWRYNSIFLVIDNSWRRVISFTARLLYPQGNRPRYSFGKEDGWVPDLVWVVWRRENRTRTVQLVARHYTN